MELLICQSCGVVLRTKGKHCTGCGVTLALHSPTSIPSFAEARPPLAVSVKQDHLLLERVVTQRQLLTLGPRPPQPGGHYGVSSGTSFPSSIASPVADYGGNGHGNGHGNGQGNGNGNGGLTVDQEEAGGILADPVGQAPPNASPALFAEPEAPLPTLKQVDSPEPGLVPVDPFAEPSGESSESESVPSGPVPEPVSEAQEPPASPPSGQVLPGSGLLSSFSSKGLLAAGAAGAAGLAAANLKGKAPLGSLADWVGTSRDEKKADSGSSENPAAAAQAAESSAVESPAVERAESSASAASQESAGEPPSSQSSGGPVVPGTYFQSFRSPGFSSSAVSIAIGAPVGPASVPSATSPPKESAPIPSDVSGSGSESGASIQPTAAVPEPQATPDLASQMTAALSAGQSGSDLEPTIPTAVEKAADVMTSEAMSSIPESKPESAARTAGIGDSLSGNSTEARGSFDFVNQVGPDFNPEEFFTTGSNQAIAPPEETGAALAASETAAAEVPAAAETPVQASPRQDLVDFFGEDNSGSQNPIASTSMAPANDTLSSGSSGDDSFDFFSGSPVSKTQMLAESMPETPPLEATALREEPPSLRVADETAVSKPWAEDEEKDERPKVAMPRGVKARPSTSIDDEEEESEEEELETGGPRPKRRSFSGNTIKPQAVKSKKDEDDEEDDEESGGAGGVIDWMEGDVNLAGQNVTRKTAVVLVAVGVFILVQIPGWCMTFFSALTGGGGQPQQAQQMPSPGMNPGMQQQVAQAPQQQGPQSALSFGKRLPGLGGQPGPMPGQPGQPQNASLDPSGFPVVGGRWQVVTFSGKQPFQSQMMINQTGAQFAGQGQDGLGMFEIAGILQPPDRIDFKKVYDKDAKRKGAISEPMIYSARLEQQGDSNLFMANGGWKSHKREGFENSIYNPARMVPISGRFQAKQLVAQATTVASNNQVAMPGIPNLPKLGGPSIGNPLAGLSPGHGQTKIQATQNLFLTIALACIGAGAAIFLFFLMLFGPAGKMNVWEKQKYIPSQFKPQHMKMVRELGKRVTPGAVPFGKRLEWAWWWPFTPTQLNLPADIRTQNPHILLIGSGDKGKTRLIAGMVTHDIKSKDRAVVVIDSDGQLSDLIIEWIAAQPEGREFAKRVMLVDPTYKAGSVAYNPLEMPDDGDLQAASSAIVHGFKAIYTEPPGAQSQWNAQTANILRNAALLLMVNGRTLTDLPNLLQDNDFRDIMLESVERRKNEKTEYITILETWNQYKKLARTDQWINWVEPILNRVGPMLSDGRIRPILTKPVSDLKLRDIIAEKKILIVKVPQGELDQNANLLGSLIVTGLQQAAMSFCKGRRETEERPVALYIDEMDNFIEKETIENLTSETKRYQVGFVGCLKTLQHLPEDYRSQLIINMGTLCVFALAKKDGDMLGPQMFRVDGRKIKHQTIQNFFNKVNTSPQFELIMDEEKLNIDRIVGQEEQTFFCYRVGTVAGTFKLKAHDFKDIPERKIDRKLVEKMHAVSDGSEESGKKKKKKSDRDVA